MRGWLSVFVASLFSVPFVVGQSRVGNVVSESGDSLRIARAVELTTEGTRRLVLNGNATGAYDLFKEAIEADSTYAPAKYALAQLLLSSSPDSAVVYSREAYLSDTTNHWYLNRYAQSVVSAQDYELARDLYEKLAALRPMNLDAYRILAILYRQDGDPLRAISILDTAEVRVGYNPYLSGLKRQLLLQTNQSERAIREARDVVEATPYAADGRVALAELYGGLGQDSAALVEYRAAFDVDSTRLETLISMAEFMNRRGKNAEYLQLLRRIVASNEMQLASKVGLVEEVLKDKARYQSLPMLINSIITELAIRHPKDKGVVDLRTKYLLSVGMVEEALSVVKSHLSDEPVQRDYYRMVCDLERYLERPDSVLCYLNRAIERMPEESAFRMELAYMYAAQSEYDRSIEMFEAELEGATDSLQGSIWGTIGDIEHQRAEFVLSQDSIQITDLAPRQTKKIMKPIYGAYDRSLKCFADNAMVLNNYAYFLCEYGGDLDDALRMSQRSNELESSNPTFIDTHAWILYRMGRYEDAKVEMRRALSLDQSRNYEIALHYGEILWVLGEETMANFYWDKATQWGAESQSVEASRERAKLNREGL